MSCLTVLCQAAAQEPLQPAYLLNTFFPPNTKISPPQIPERLRDPALRASPPPPPPFPGLTVFSKPEAEPDLSRQPKALPGRFTFQPEVSGPHVRVLKQSPPPQPRGPGVSSLPLLSDFPFNSAQFPQISNSLFGPENFADFLGNARTVIPPAANQPSPSPPARFPPRGLLVEPPQLQQPLQQLRQLQQQQHPSGASPPPPPPTPPAPSPPSLPPRPIPAPAAKPHSRFPVQLTVGPAVPAVPNPDQPFNEKNELTPGTPTPVNSFQSVTGLVQPLLATPTSNFIPDRLGPGCKTTYVEECHHEYKMVCEETTVQRDRKVCQTVKEKVCEQQQKIDYEPACFQRIISHCDRVKVDFTQHVIIIIMMTGLQESAGCELSAPV